VTKSELNTALDAFGNKLVLRIGGIFTALLVAFVALDRLLR